MIEAKTKSTYMIQIANDPEVEAMIKRLANDERRSIGNQIAVLIREAYYSRYQDETTKE